MPKLNVPVFTQKFLENIIPLKKELAKLKYYETSDIISIINLYENKTLEFEEWKQQLETAILFSNELRYIELISYE
ncbi:MAG: hypothetical protein IT239_02185 [Bacteroidia bacterium]|nr:hypothetical protein [Bacteroidia bacterium]